MYTLVIRSDPSTPSSLSKGLGPRHRTAGRAEKWWAYLLGARRRRGGARRWRRVRRRHGEGPTRTWAPGVGRPLRPIPCLIKTAISTIVLSIPISICLLHILIIFPYIYI